MTLLARAVRPTLVRVSPQMRAAYSSNFSFDKRPGPPPLPKEQQEEFERLQKIASSQAAIDEYNAQVTGETSDSAPVLPKLDIGTFMYNHTIPEFEGDVNPKTGEVGGPKQDPIRHGDWLFNGRVTDF